MSEQFYNKDYGDYFSRLEQQLTRTAEPPTASQPPVRRTRRSLRMRRRIAQLRRAAVLTVAAAIVVTGGYFAVRALAGNHEPAQEVGKDNEGNGELETSGTDLRVAPFSATNATVVLGDEIQSSHVVFINLDTNEIIAQKSAQTRAFPASTTKIMTALVAAELITDFSDTFTMTVDITDPLYIAGATVAGFSIGEKVNMTDLLYGTILPSGGDAAIGLAEKLTGSETGLVRRMNERAKQMGLTDTHFTNVTGLHDQSHYTTAVEMAMILREAISNPLCRQILSTYQYTTAETPQHPEGIELTSTLFSYMYGSEPEDAQIDGGKTGYVDESGYCIATFGHGDSGTRYLCVTMRAPSKWPAVYDQINLFTTYAK